MAPPPAGCWIYCGVFPEEDRIAPTSASRRICSDMAGDSPGPTTAASSITAPPPAPTASRGASARNWSGGMTEKQRVDWPDIADLRQEHAARPSAEHRQGQGTEALGGDKPFTLHPDGVGWLYVAKRIERWSAAHALRTAGIAVRNPLYPSSRRNPAADKKERPDNPYADSPDDPRFPYVLTTYRLTEHHTAGGMSRTLSPSCRTAAGTVLRGFAGTGGRDRSWSTATGSRSSRRAASLRRACLVTPRMRPLWIDGRTVHQVGLPYHWGYRGHGDRRRGERSARHLRGAERAHHGNQGAWSAISMPARRAAGAQKRWSNCERRHGDSRHERTTAFLTDSTLCIGCKACEVACKEWNGIDEDGLDWTGFSYDNTGAVGHSTWRHVKFVEDSAGARASAAMRREQLSWEFSSDVCKHCENAGCLEACPTGSIVRTEFGGVFVQPDSAMAAATA